MRSALAILGLLALAACQPIEQPTQSTALPPLIVSRITNIVDRDRVLLVWSVQNADERRFEILRKNRDEPWKHFVTVVPVDQSIQFEDTGVIPGQRYLYRLRLLGAPGDA